MNESNQLSESYGGGLQANLIKNLPALLSPIRLLKAVRSERGKGRSSDFFLDIKTPKGKKEKLIMGIRPLVLPGNIRETIQKLRGSLPSKTYPVLASLFISPEPRNVCREEKIGYVDLAGDFYLDLPDFYIEKSVEKNPYPRRGRPPSLFSPISTRIIRAFLEEPDRIWKVSELAITVDVSLGQTSKITRKLLQEGYVVKIGRELKVTKPGLLLDTWRDQYPTEKNRRSAYYSFEQDPQKLMKKLAQVAKENNWPYAVTSFSAAALVPPFVRGVSKVEWYIKDEIMTENWIKALDLRLVESGANAILISPADLGVFYRSQKVDNVTLASNIQLYLDLYKDPARGKEQAEFLRKEKIGF